jgi:hypothetical protein
MPAIYLTECPQLIQEEERSIARTGKIAVNISITCSERKFQSRSCLCRSAEVL